MPYLPDMARLEWLLHRAYYAPDAAALGPGCFAGLAPETFESARFELHPACAVFSSAWAVVPLWLAHQGSGTPCFPERLDAPSHGLITRAQFAPQLREIDAACAAALRVFGTGAAMGEAIDAAFAVDPACDLAAQLLLWAESGALAAPQRGTVMTRETGA